MKKILSLFLISAHFSLLAQVEMKYNAMGGMNSSGVSNTTIIHGNYVDDRDTLVKDRVLNRSNLGDTRLHH